LSCVFFVFVLGDLGLAFVFPPFSSFVTIFYLIMKFSSSPANIQKEELSDPLYMSISERTKKDIQLRAKDCVPRTAALPIPFWIEHACFICICIRNSVLHFDSLTGSHARQRRKISMVVMSVVW
jgi:hypothetical protein